MQDYIQEWKEVLRGAGRFHKVQLKKLVIQALDCAVNRNADDIEDEGTRDRILKKQTELQRWKSSLEKDESLQYSPEQDDYLRILNDDFSLKVKAKENKISVFEDLIPCLEEFIENEEESHGGIDHSVFDSQLRDRDKRKSLAEHFLEFASLDNRIDYLQRELMINEQRYRKTSPIWTLQAEVDRDRMEESLGFVRMIEGSTPLDYSLLFNRPIFEEPKWKLLHRDREGRLKYFCRVEEEKDKWERNILGNCERTWGVINQQLGDLGEVNTTSDALVCLQKVGSNLQKRASHHLKSNKYLLKAFQVNVGKHYELLQYYQLFEKRSRDGKEGEYEKKQLVIRPPQTLAELVGCKSRDHLSNYPGQLQYDNLLGNFCFFDQDQNLAQLYLYAAHVHTRLLGIWMKDEEGGEEMLGLVPMLMLRDKKGKKPWLYVEAPMVPAGLATQRVEFQGENIEVNFYQALIEIVGAYSVLHAGQPMPIAGCARKADAAYSSTLVPWIETLTEQFSTQKYPNKVSFGSATTAQKGIRKVTRPKYFESLELELPDYQKLLGFLQHLVVLKGSNLYEYNKLLTNTQSYLNDPDHGSKTLYDQWQEMSGEVDFIPIIKYLLLVHDMDQLDKGKEFTLREKMGEMWKRCKSGVRMYVKPVGKTGRRGRK